MAYASGELFASASQCMGQLMTSGEPKFRLTLYRSHGERRHMADSATSGFALTNGLLLIVA